MRSNESEMDGLVGLCIEAAAAGRESVERWRRQRRTLERLPAPLADALLRRLRRRRLLYPSLLEVFQNCVESVDLEGEISVDVEWMVYLGGFRYLSRLDISDCKNVNNSALWHLAGLDTVKELDLSRCSKVTDDGVQHLLSLSNLEKLGIAETKLTAKGVMLLSSLTCLRVLDLGGLPVTDMALNSLKVLSHLEHLDLWGSEVSNTGAALLESFPMLSFVNLAWTSVTKVPALPALTCLNMSKCAIHSISSGDCEVKVHLSKLIALDASFVDIGEAFSSIESSCLSYLDLSGSTLPSFNATMKMKGLEYLNLSSTAIGDESVAYIANIGANLRELNLSQTKVTSEGISTLAGNVPNLQSLTLSHTALDDAALSYMALMPSLKMIDLSYTKIIGIDLAGNKVDDMLTLTKLQNLAKLESLNLEETQVKDLALRPIEHFKELTCLYLKSDFLTINSLLALSFHQKLKVLGFRGAVLTDPVLSFYTPPPSLRVLDFTGCWLLTEEAILSFSKRNPHIDIKHGHFQMHAVEPNTCSSSRLHKVNRASKSKQEVSLTQSLDRFGKHDFADERIKYSREEMMELQHSPLSDLSMSDINMLPKILRG